MISCLTLTLTLWAQEEYDKLLEANNELATQLASPSGRDQGVSPLQDAKTMHTHYKPHCNKQEG